MNRKYYNLAIPISILVAIIIFISSGCGTTPVKNVPLPGEPVAHVPKMTVGDTWVYTGFGYGGTDTFTSKVVEVQADGGFVTERKSKKKNRTVLCYWNNKYQKTRMVDKDSGNELDVLTPPAKYPDFPLFVGKQWSDKYTGSSITGSTDDYANDYFVESYGKVSTKAGTFDAFKISRQHYNISRGRRTSFFSTFWYSPKLKIVIKSEPDWRIGKEVISYRLAKAKITPPIIEITFPKTGKDGATVINAKQVNIQGFIKGDNAISWLKIDGNTVEFNSSGQFSYLASLQDGENIIDIKASDEIGNETNRRLAVNYVPLKAAIKHNTVKQVSTPNKHYENEVRWALVIGISNYQDTRIPSLRYAAFDARLFYDWLISPEGGKYAPARVKLLIDHEATLMNIKAALFKWLKQSIKEDVVTIYFAGHGSPDSPDSPNNLFLLPYDAQYDDVAATGFAMWDIGTAIKRFIEAEKVIVIADACHAGGVGRAFDIARRTGRAIKVNPISSGLQNLSKIGDGVCVISASDDRQFSQEGRHWGGGHGVFTYFLLKSLKGKADYNMDRNVTLGELIPYLSEKVRRATKNAQSPTVAGRFDPALSIGK